MADLDELFGPNNQLPQTEDKSSYIYIGFGLLLCGLYIGYSIRQINVKKT